MLDQVGIELIGLVISGVIALVFGCMIVVSQPRLGAARYFFLATLGISGWSLGIAAFLLLESVELALFFIQTYYISAALIAVGMLSVAVTVGGGWSVKGWLLAPWLSFGALSAAVALFPDFMVHAIAIGSPNTVQLHPVGYVVYCGYFLVLFAMTILVLVRKSRQMHQIAARTQLKWLLYAYGPAGFIGALYNLILPAFGNYNLIWVGPLSVILFVPFAYFAIARHGLFDLRGATVRTIAYVMTLTVLGLAYYGIAYGASALIESLGVSAGTTIGPLNVAVALGLAFIFQPIKRFFDQLTNRLFYRGKYDKDIFFRELGRILSYDTDLRLLLRQASAYIATNLGAERVFFYIADHGVYHGSGARKSRMPDADIQKIAQYYQATHEFPEVVLADTVKSPEVGRILASHRVYVVLPLILQGEAVGYLFAGEHKGRGYTVRDVKVLESIANELTIAVRNSLSVEEVRELNESLQRKIDDATSELRLSNQQLQRLDEAKDEFISMASHQLRTPLTSIKGYLDMVLQGDLGKVSSTQRAVLSEAFISSERMVTLINDFLNVSRLQTGKFMIERRESDLAEAMNDQLQMLAVVAKQHDLALKPNIDKDLPRVAVDIDKIRQVMLNMIDNAIYYSKPGTTVNISLVREGKDIAFRVKDTGIGVPKSEQSGLFGKFFRATNARKKRPDGTGVGLFLAKKVILAHGGQVIFESKEGKGSTFGFKVPIA